MIARVGVSRINANSIVKQKKSILRFLQNQYLSINQKSLVEMDWIWFLTGTIQIKVPLLPGGSRKERIFDSSKHLSLE